MFKFKVGDRVLRARHSTNISNCPIGYQTVVTGLLGDGKPYGIWYIAPDGRRQNSTSLQDWDLVEPIESPIRTVTRRELVPGVYGRVKVSPENYQGQHKENGVSVCLLTRDGQPITLGSAALNADELRSLAMVASQLAEFLDEDKGGE